jgi:NADPH-dependent 2,4-dienoyl-CoA reductase/sulfur reductase-like enzyme
LEIGRGILVNDFLETNFPDVYAVGDCVELRQPQPGRRPIEAVWYTGRMMGEALGNILSGNRQPYRPGMWFNSAKFFDIEYQVYGQMPGTLPPEWESLYRESADGQRAVRLVWERTSGALVGIHAFGIRLRQAVCEQWILSGKHYQAVQKDIQDAHFDPELFPKLLKSLF